MPRTDRTSGRARSRVRPDDDSVELSAEHAHAWWVSEDHGAPLATPTAWPTASPRHLRPTPDPGPTAAGEAGWSHEPTPAGPHAGRDPLAGWAPIDDQRGHDAEARGTSTEPEPEPDLWLREHVGAPRRAAEAASPWEVLGLRSDAPWSVVRARQKELAKQFHPDRHGTDDPAARADAEIRMAEINVAVDDIGRIMRLSG